MTIFFMRLTFELAWRALVAFALYFVDPLLVVVDLLLAAPDFHFLPPTLLDLESFERAVVAAVGGDPFVVNIEDVCADGVQELPVVADDEAATLEA
jgi:hypothetical protein